MLHARKRPQRANEWVKKKGIISYVFVGSNALFRIHLYVHALLIGFYVSATKNLKASKGWHQQEALKNYAVGKKRRHNELPLRAVYFWMSKQSRQGKMIKKEQRRENVGEGKQGLGLKNMNISEQEENIGWWGGAQVGVEKVNKSCVSDARK